MAVFNQNTLNQVSGFNNQIIDGELVYSQKTYWNLVWTNSTGAPLDLTGATISAQIVRRELSNIVDTRNGLTFDIADYLPTPTPVTLTISNLNSTGGTFTLVIDDTAWSLIATDPELEINAQNPVGFSGRIKVAMPASGGTPEDDLIVFLLFLVRSDGVVVV